MSSPADLPSGTARDRPAAAAPDPLTDNPPMGNPPMGNPGDDPFARVSIVIIAHDSAAVIGRCLEALGADAAVTLMDNASADATCAIARRLRPATRIRHSTVNLGFGAAANAALGPEGPEFALLLNPDWALAPGALEELLAAADRNPDAGLLAPRLQTEDGRLIACHDLPLFARGRPQPGRGAQAPPSPPEGDLCAGYLPGMAMLLRRRAFHEIGGFDPLIFQGYEDEDLCLRLSAAGHSLVLVADALACRLGLRAASRNAAADRVKSWHLGWSRLYIERKYRSAAAAFRLGIGMLCRRGFLACLFALLGRRARAGHEAAGFAGSLAFLLGHPARPPSPFRPSFGSPLPPGP